MRQIGRDDAARRLVGGVGALSVRRQLDGRVCGDVAALNRPLTAQPPQVRVCGAVRAAERRLSLSAICIDFAARQRRRECAD
jgi:hypothetical protein